MSACKPHQWFLLSVITRGSELRSIQRCSQCGVERTSTKDTLGKEYDTFSMKEILDKDTKEK